MTVSILEELEQIAEAFTTETNPEKLVELSKQLLFRLDRIEAGKSKSESVA